ncbi:Multicopper oxidase [Desulfatibacillum alkenivorans DSM 16219]|jgi:FtsP/CotA-like multicopper oxidase with cupredoxin domain|uniref:Multicopper oxidase n=1 Tax=Desulfatibacillum alkenivorans DSM 16219 TaxID=1121393 RepID=A0A1M6UZB5_9BACT|nr:multicopper oxidase domain-containing protein [Desulfatibacillum alkenivorans]SHK74481.1 Multicopper oxidase [Desulfatibacillum alkenivorans DSM 16219]
MARFPGKSSTESRKRSKIDAVKRKQPSSKASGLLAFGLLFLFASLPAQAAAVEYDLTISKQPVNITGEPREAMTLNGGIPDPVLRFREGDFARIRVHNKPVPG